MRRRFLQRSGRRTLLERALVLPSLLVAGCNYGFTGGGFPSHIRTIHIETFDNETAHFELQQQIFAAMLERLPGSLGARPAARDNADAIVRGRIIRYNDQAQNYRAADAAGNARILEYQVEVTLEVSIIDVTRDPPVILWKSQGLVGRGQYAATQTDQVGREQAIEHLLQQIVDGAQSQW